MIAFSISNHIVGNFIKVLNLTFIKYLANKKTKWSSCISLNCMGRKHLGPVGNTLIPPKES